MMALPPPTKSPKRKRDDAESQYGGSPLTSSPRHHTARNLHENHVIDKEEIGRDSPRTAVAGYLGDLEIYEDGMRQRESEHRVIATDGKLPIRSRTGKEKSPLTDPSGSDELLGNNSLQSKADREETGDNPPARKKGRVSMSPASSPKAKHGTNGELDSKRRSKSPPLRSNPEENPFTWSDSEITGHLGTDPNDDGYGINGLGFKPTPAIAWSRSERRKKQIAEWKSREAREARQLRREKRDGTAGESSEGNLETKNSSPKKVKFDA